MDEDVERRLREWGRWMRGDGVLGFGRASVWDTASSRSGYKVLVIPTSACDAQVTDLGISTLLANQRAVIFKRYQDDLSVPAVAESVGVGVSTVHKRIGEAHAALSTWLVARSRAAAAEHARVQSLGAGYGAGSAKKSFTP
jgi:hypothetical protein